MNENVDDNLSTEEKPPLEEQLTPGDQLPEDKGSLPDDQEVQTSTPMGIFNRFGFYTIGFLGWFLLNGLLWLLISGEGEISFEVESNLLSNGLCIFPLNLAIMFFLFWRKDTRKIGQGILAAYGVNLIISLILGLGYNAFCLVPFFT